MDVSQEPKTKEDVKNMLKHLEDEYRKANITENTYKELKEKYKQQLSYMDNTINPEEAKVESPAPAAEEKKGGLLGGLFHKKKETEPAPQPAAAPAAEQPSVTVVEDRQEEPKQTGQAMAAVQQLSIELEKLKVMLDAARDQKKSTDESIQSIFEGIGEVRSMSIQNDASQREIMSKLERAEDDMNNLKPKELEKRFTQINEVLEKYQITLEKLQAKSNDMSERLGKVYETVKVIGNTENLAGLNQNVQKKLNDIREATNYVERLSSKAEKIFIDLKMELEDLVVYKSKQEAMEESVKDILKSMDAIGIKFEGYTTRKESEDEKQDIMILGKQQEDIKNVMAIAQTSVPEPILQLRKEREDIKLFLDSMEEQLKAGRLKAVEYETAKKKNMEKLKEIDGQLLAEWKKYEKLSKEVPAPAPVVNIVEAGQQAEEVKPEEITGKTQTPPAEAQEIENPSQAAEAAQTSEEPKPADEKKDFMNKVEEKIKKEEAVTGVPADQAPSPTENKSSETVPKPAEKKKKISVSLPF